MKSKLIKDFSENSYVYVVNDMPDPCGLKFQVQFTGYEEIGLNYRLERQNYQSFMLTYVKKGSFICIYDNKYYLVPQDSLCFIDCMTPHKTWGAEEYTVCYIHIIHPMLSRFFGYITSISSPVIPLYGDSIGFLDCVDKIHKMIRENCYDSDIASSLIYSMLIKLKNLVETSSSAMPTVPVYINNLILYIEEHYREKLTLKLLADLVGFSPNYLDSAFKKYVGTSMGRYISLLRLKKSQKLLLTSEKSLSEIALETGYGDVQALIRSYKKYFNTTPMKYRAQYRNAGKNQKNSTP